LGIFDLYLQLFTLVSDLYMNGTAKDMRRWAYEIHSTFILKDAPLAIKLEDGVIETIEFTLKVCSLFHMNLD